MSEELSSLNKVHDEEDSELVLEYIMHWHDEGMEYIEQDFFLQFQGVHLLVFDYNIFSYALHGINLAVLDISHLEHFSESSFSHDVHQLEVLKHCFVGLVSLEHDLGRGVARDACLDLILLVRILFLSIFG